MVFLVVNYYFWKNSDIVNSMKFMNYWEMLSAIGVIAGFFAIYVEYTKSLEQTALEQQQLFTQQMQANWIDLEKYFVTSYPYLTRLYQQIYDKNPTIMNPPLKWTPKEYHKMRMYEIHTCSILFQIIENIVASSSHLLQYEIDEWIVAWRSWFKSPIVREQWKYMRSYYNIKTQGFIDSCLLKSQSNCQISSFNESQTSPKILGS